MRKFSEGKYTLWGLVEKPIPLWLAAYPFVWVYCTIADAIRHIDNSPNERMWDVFEP